MKEGNIKNDKGEISLLKNKNNNKYLKIIMNQKRKKMLVS